MFIELNNLDGGQIFIRTDDVRRILTTPKGTKVVFADGESLLVSENAVDIYHELKGMEDSEPGMGVWP